MSIFTNGLVALRERKGFVKLGDFAEALDMVPDYYDDLESGTANPTIDDLLAISYATGMSIDFIVCGQNFKVSA